jgi:hypothetical protein
VRLDGVTCDEALAAVDKRRLAQAVVRSADAVFRVVAFTQQYDVDMSCAGSGRRAQAATTSDITVLATLYGLTAEEAARVSAACTYSGVRARGRSAS